MTDIALTPALVQQYDRLQNIREEWCSLRLKVAKDRTDETIVLDGSKIDGIPGFFLTLGEEVNGTDGYFGACLDSLSDCLCGGFGLALPLTIKVLNERTARENLGSEAIAVWDLLQGQRISAAIDADQVNSNAASLPNAPVLNYFDQVLEVFQNAGVKTKLIQ